MRALLRRAGVYARVAAACVTDPGVMLARGRYLFLLSHMRSYSSVLAHVLGSHPEISGHLERLRGYRRPVDLLRSRAEDRGSGGRPRYTLDKVLHDGYAIHDRIIGRPDVTAIIFIRAPEPTFKSIVHMGRDLLDDPRYRDPARIFDYYTRRLDSLCAHAERLARPALFFDAQRVVRQPDELLPHIGRWLGLGSPLGPEYTVFPDSRERNRGDPSTNLREGRVLTDAARDYDVDIPADLLDAARAHHARTVERLGELCDTPG